jgi:hypothetical protein
VQYRKNRVVFTQGDEADAGLEVHSGLLNVVLHD